MVTDAGITFKHTTPASVTFDLTMCTLCDWSHALWGSVGGELPVDKEGRQVALLLLCITRCVLVWIPWGPQPRLMRVCSWSASLSVLFSPSPIPLSRSVMFCPFSYELTVCHKRTTPIF